MAEPSDFLGKSPETNERKITIYTEFKIGDEVWWLDRSAGKIKSGIVFCFTIWRAGTTNMDIDVRVGRLMEIVSEKAYAFQQKKNC